MRFDFLDRLVGSYIPWREHISDHAILLDDGGVVGMLELQGVPWETLDAFDTRQRTIRLNHTLKQISDDTITLLVQQSRGLADPSVVGDHRSAVPFVAELSRRYRNKLLESRLFENRIFITVNIQPKVYGSKFVEEQARFRRKAVEVADEDVEQKLEDVMKLLMVELRSYRPRRLGVRLSDVAVFSEIAEATMLLMTGVWRPVPLSTGLLSEQMFSENIIFDRDMIRLIMPGGETYACILSMKVFPSATNAWMFNRLLTTPYECSVCQSFRYVNTSDAQGIMKRKRSRMVLANDPAAEQVDDLKKAASDLANSDYSMGRYSFSFMVFADSPKELDRVATQAWTDLAESGTTVVREYLGLESAYVSMLSGNSYYQPRPGYISTRNLSGLAPMVNFPAGLQRSHWGEPIIVLRSPANTPIRLHWHYRDVANVLVTGETGSGKTTLIAMMLAMTESRARILALDHKQGWEMLITVMGGDYSSLGAGEAHFAPLKALSLEGPKARRNYRFLIELLRGCITQDGRGGLSSEEDRRLALGIRTVMRLPPEMRCLAEVRNFLGVQSEGAGDRLQKWCHGQELGWVIDAPADNISFSGRIHGVDTTALLDDPRARDPALFYLFHRIELELDGKPVLIPIDEGWRALLDGMFRPMIERRLRTIRSFNGALVLITQTGEELIKSDIAKVLVQQCPTQIHFPNPRASEEDYIQGLKRTKGEFEVLRNLRTGSGYFLLCQGPDSCVAQLSLPDMEDLIAVLSGRESTVKLFREALAETNRDIGRTLAKFHEARALEDTL